MKRLAIIVSVGGFLIGLALVLSPRITARLVPSVPSLSEAAAPPESEELALPTLEPSMITPGVGTFLSVSATIADETIRRLRLQFFDQSRLRWKTVTRLKDDGEFPDALGGDRIFTGRLRLLESSGSVGVYKLGKKRSPVLKGTTTIPVALRLVAKRKGVHGMILVSPPLALPVATLRNLLIGGGGGAPTASVSIPETIDSVNADDPTNVWLEKSGTDGYSMNIKEVQNPTAMSLPQWVDLNIYGGDGVDRSPLYVPFSAGGLVGFSYQAHDQSGEVFHVWLDDPMNGRLFSITAEPGGADQYTTFEGSMEEILSAIASLHF